MKTWAALGLAAMLLAHAPAMAQTVNDNGRAAKARAGVPVLQQELYRGSRIIGAAVRDNDGKKIGNVRDLLLDSGRGEVAYAVVRFSTGKNRMLHPVPWRALVPGDDGRHYVLQADPETVGQAPGFSSGRWPDMSDQRWSDEIDRYWNRAVGSLPFSSQPLTSGNAAGAASSGGSGSGGTGNSGRPPSRRE